MKQSFHQINIDGVPVGNEKEISDHFNRYFLSVFSDTDAFHYKGYSSHKLSADFIPHEDVFSLLLNLIPNMVVDQMRSQMRF